MAKAKIAKNSAAVEDCGEHMSVSVRKIDNGFIVSHSKSGPKGYSRTEVYHPAKPAIDVPALKRAAGSKKPKNT